MDSLQPVQRLLETLSPEVGDGRVRTSLSVVLESGDVTVETRRAGRRFTVRLCRPGFAKKYRKNTLGEALVLIRELLCGRQSAFLGMRLLSVFGASVPQEDRQEWVYSMHKRHGGCSVGTRNGLIVSGESRDYVCMLVGFF